MHFGIVVCCSRYIKVYGTQWNVTVMDITLHYLHFIVLVCVVMFVLRIDVCQYGVDPDGWISAW